MGQRQDLLEGAKRCLVERGYAHTTARDVTAASGANLGSIGYHFGSKDALMNEAMIELCTEAAGRLREPNDWQTLIDSFAEQPAMWISVLEAFTHAARFPELRERLAEAQAEARTELGGDSAGAVRYALIAGVMLQHLIDPERAPGAEAITEGLKALAAEA
jgi:AcrR family transcriptional regulator